MECIRNTCKPFLGSLYSFLAALVICLWGLTLKTISSPSGLQASLVKMCVFYMISIPMITYKSVWLRKPSRHLSLKNYAYLVVDAISGVSCVVFTTIALEYSSIGNVYAIGSSYQIPMLFIACLFLNERPHWLEILLAVVSAGGVFLVARPSFLFDQGIVYDASQIKGLVYACLVCISLAIRIASDSKVLQFSSNSDIILWTGALGAFITPLIMWTTQSGLFLPCLKDCVLLLVSALLALISRLLLMVAVKVERANLVAMIYCTQVFIGYIFDVIYTQAPPSYISVLGGTIIVFSSITSMFLKVWLLKRQTTAIK